jgi:hypothetical protein
MTSVPHLEFGLLDLGFAVWYRGELVLVPQRIMPDHFRTLNKAQMKLKAL